MRRFAQRVSQPTDRLNCRAIDCADARRFAHSPGVRESDRRARRLITTSVTHPALDAELLRAVDRRPTPRVRRLADDLRSLRVPLEYPRVTSVNVYLVALTDGWLLVDTGTDLGSLQTALAEAGVHPNRVRALLVTHAHPDHSAQAAPLCDLYGWPLLRGTGPVTAVDPLRDPQVPQAVRHAHCRRAGVPEADLALMADAVVTGRLGAEERRPADLTVAHGDAFDGPQGALGGRRAPGPFARADRAVGPRPPSPDRRRPRLSDWDRVHRVGRLPHPYAEQLGSLQRASALRPAVLYPGHGRPDAEPELRIDAPVESSRHCPSGSCEPSPADRRPHTNSRAGSRPQRRPRCAPVTSRHDARDPRPSGRRRPRRRRRLPARRRSSPRLLRRGRGQRGWARHRRRLRR